MSHLAAITHIRLALADMGTPSLLETATAGMTYNDLYEHEGGEAGGAATITATIRSGAAILAGYFAQQPSSVSGGGESVSWAPERFKFYDAISKGGGGGMARGASTPTVGSMGVTTEVSW